MVKLSDFGGGGFELTELIVLPTSTTWVPDFSGPVRVHVIGGGGGGSSATQSYWGGGGSWCWKDIEVTSGESYTVTVGAAAFNGAGNATLGNESSFVGNGQNLVAPGGHYNTQPKRASSGGDVNLPSTDGGVLDTHDGGPTFMAGRYGIIDGGVLRAFVEGNGSLLAMFGLFAGAGGRRNDQSSDSLLLEGYWPGGGGAYSSWTGSVYGKGAAGAVIIDKKVAV